MTDPMAEWARMRNQSTESTQIGASTPPVTHVSPGGGRSGSAAVLALVGGVVAVLVIAGAGVFFLSEWAGELQASDGPGSPGAEPAAGSALLVSEAGFTQFLDALEKETGSTTVVDLTLYPTYAVAAVPEPGGKGRTRSYYYDGSIRETGLGTTTEAELDLTTVDPAVLVKLSKKARRAVDNPTQWYLILGAPDVQGAVIYAYASNAYGEGGYIAADLDGKVVNKAGW